MKQPKLITTGYTPRPFQALLHANLKRFNVVICHRRFGKTHFAINEKIDQGFRKLLKNPQYAYIAPNYGQAKRVAWDILKDYLKEVPGVETNESELRVDIPRPNLGDRIRIMLLGAENPASIKGIYLDGVTLDEYAECDPRVWSEAVRPALSDRLGWANFIGTPKGQNHFHEVLMMAKRDPVNWYHVIYKASETGIISKEELALARQTMSQEEYDQEYECSFTAALIGSYYGKYMEDAEKDGRVREVPYDPAVLVNTYWDLGIGDTTVIWFIQQVGSAFHCIDYYEMSGKGLEHYVKILRDKNYTYDEHYLPHDAAARSLDTGRTREETLRGLGLRRTRIVPKQNVDDGINAVRVLLPRTYFDAKKCERGISALKNYERKWDAKNRIFSDTPLHNWASNGADAFRTFGVGLKDITKRPDPSTLPRETDRDFNIFDRSS